MQRQRGELVPIGGSTTQKRQLVVFDIDIGWTSFLVDLLYLRSIGQSFDMSFLNDDVFEDRSAYRIQVFFPRFCKAASIRSINTVYLLDLSAISARFFHS